MANSPKRHHFIPQSYLAAWSDSSSQVAVRRRGSTNVVTPHIKNVGLEGGLYGRGDTAQRIESLYGELDGAWPRLRSELTREIEPTESDREQVALFMAFQMTRTPDSFRKAEFVENVVEFAQTDGPTRDQVAAYLRTSHLRFEPSENEVEAAWAFVTGTKNMSTDERPLTRLDSVSMAFESAVLELAPRLQRRPWRILECRKRILVTSDRPVTNWRRPSREDLLGGIGIVDATEIRFPVSPRHLLVLSKTGPQFAYETAKPEVFYKANTEAIARCEKAVIASPHRADYLKEAKMADLGPTLRFRIGPGYRQAPGGQQTRMNDIIQIYTPRY